MKITVEYNLPDDQYEFDFANKAKSYYNVIFELQHNFIKQQMRYLDNKEHTSEEEYALLEKITKDIVELLDNNDCIM